MPSMSIMQNSAKNKGKLAPKNITDTIKPWRYFYIDTIRSWEISINEIKKGKSSLNKKTRTKLTTIYASTIINELTS